MTGKDPAHTEGLQGVTCVFQFFSPTESTVNADEKGGTTTCN